MNQPKIIQIQPWHDMLLGLADDGKIYRLDWVDGYYNRAEFGHFSVDGVPVFSGLVVR